MNGKWLSIGLSLAFMLAMSLSVSGQNTALPYFNGFENDGDTAGWTFKKATGASGFAIGTATHCLGYKSMYISPDNGVTASYGTTTSGYVTVAYKSFTLAAGTYDLAFDYKVGGDGTNQDMKVAWMPASSTINASSDGSSYPSVIVSNQLTSNGLKQSEWTHITLNVSVPTGGGTYNLCFAFRCNSQTVSAPGACLDNIQLDEQKSIWFDCTFVPYNLSVARNNQGNTVISWSGQANQYEVMAASVSDPNDHNICHHTGITARSDTMPFSDFGNGLYFFYVRAICGNDTSMYAETSMRFYNDSLRNFTFPVFDASGTICTYGSGSNPSQNTGIIDNGPSQISSQHTIHTDTSELDPRTNSGLHTVPAGETWSVRLGNWNDSAHGQSITYAYTVPNNKVLIMKYAVVAEISRHTDPAEFKIEIMNSYHQIIDYSLYYIYESPDYFYSSSCLCVVGWNRVANWTDPISGMSHSDIFWKDWTTIGFNLSQCCAGQTVLVRITTKSCDWGGHFGYGYFTFSSEDTQLSPMTCDSTQTTEFKAPDGFNYSWKNDCTGQIVSTAQTLPNNVPNNCSYTCTCTCTSDSTRSFTITANPKPIQPEASFAYAKSYSNCQTQLTFNNLTRAYTMKNGVKTYLPNESVTAHTWSVSTQHRDRCYYNMSSSDSVLSQISIPQEGDTIQVTLTSWINDCDDDTTITLYIPAMKTDSIVNLSLYQGGYVMVEDTVIYAPGNYTIVRTNRQGCSVTYHITVTQISQYTVTVNSNDATMGSVYGGGQYYDGTTVYLSAYANSGYEFTRWSNGDTNAYMSFTVVSDTTFTAYFQAVGGSSVDEVEGNGSAVIAPNPVNVGETISIKGDFTDEEMDGMVVDILGTDGAVVGRTSVSNNTIEIEGINAVGTYIVRITTGTGKVYVEKLMVK